MALLAAYKSGAAVNPAAYYSVSNYMPNLRNKTVDVRAEVYTSADQRTAYKAADAALISLASQIATQQAAVQAKQAARTALDTAFDAKDDADKNAGLADYQAAVAQNNSDIAALNTAIESLKQEQSAQTQTLNANRPGDTVTFTTKPGAVAIADTGAVTLGDIYTYLAANDLSGGTRA